MGEETLPRGPPSPRAPAECKPQGGGFREGRGTSCTPLHPTPSQACASCPQVAPAARRDVWKGGPRASCYINTSGTLASPGLLPAAGSNKRGAQPGRRERRSPCGCWTWYILKLHTNTQPPSLMGPTLDGHPTSSKWFNHLGNKGGVSRGAETPFRRLRNQWGQNPYLRCRLRLVPATGVPPQQGAVEGPQGTGGACL